LLLHAERMAQVIDVCAASAAVIEPSLLAVLQATGTPASSRFTALPCVVPEQLFAGSGEGVQPVMVEPEAPAFIQFTSGSTSDPKGVVISQSAALHNCRFIGERLRVSARDVGCSWLPLFHDMGLIGHLLVPLYWGTPSVLLPPEVFARQPRVWLEALGRHRATITTAPNSAYDICASKILERDVARLDLSSVRAALCGGEPVLPGTLRRFAGRFAEAGFRHSSFVPVYGLAEATLAATMTEPDATLRFECFERTRLEQRGEAVTATPESAPSGLVELAAVGRPRELGGVRIVDESGQGLPERRVGVCRLVGPA
jgi:acyl-CoA synthetase (AMP-forming)/AMP-acid ligase II